MQALEAHVKWDSLQREEVLVLVDWVLQLPPELPITLPLKDCALRCVSHQVSSPASRHHLLWRADVGRLPATVGQRLTSQCAMTLGGRRMYLTMERVGSKGEWNYSLVTGE
jgi:hypothetical protein